MCRVTGSSASAGFCVGVGLCVVFVRGVLFPCTHQNQHVKRLIIHGATAERGVT